MINRIANYVIEILYPDVLLAKKALTVVSTKEEAEFVLRKYKIIITKAGLMFLALTIGLFVVAACFPVVLQSPWCYLYTVGALYFMFKLLVGL